MTTLNIPADAVRDVVAHAILESIDQETRTTILTDAVAGILTAAPAQRGWVEPGKSPLAAAFEQAVNTAVLNVTREMIEADETVQAAIRTHVGEAIAVVAHGNWAGLPEAIGEAVGKWLKERNL